ncbi:hypothetical protein L1049_023611 [Liquidambar formosana]|uniref:F-box domain-containing protein n=1 Tax=Liquidambar formosana TaxID=63359 RepID=A0AAP0X3N3_LIQFO
MNRKSKISRTNIIGYRRRSSSKEEEEVAAAKSRSTLEILPCAIVIDILSRLPLKNIFHCRCVSKTWLNLLLSPDFARTHLMRSPSSLLLQWSKHRRKGGQSLFSLDLKATNVLHRSARLKFDFLLTKRRYNLSDSCNGLVCLCDSVSHNPVCILNPLTGDYITLPQSQRRFEVDIPFCGMGFCPKTNQYKLIRFVCRHTPPSPLSWEVEIFTLGTASWRSTGCTPKSVPTSGYYRISNGSLNWLDFRLNSSECIWSFDFSNETVRSFPPPPQFGPHHEDVLYWMRLGVLDDCLCICDSPSGSYFDIWVMKEYGVQESWTKQFVIDAPVLDGPWNDYLPIKLLNDGEILMLQNGETLVSYSFGEKSVKKVKIRGIPSNIDAVSYLPSFVSFKDIAMGENLKVLNVKSSCADSAL